MTAAMRTTAMNTAATCSTLKSAAAAAAAAAAGYNHHATHPVVGHMTTAIGSGTGGQRRMRQRKHTSRV